MRAVICLSGGMDSATLIPIAKEHYNSVEAIGFTYGSKHNKYENQAAANLADCYGIPFKLIDLAFMSDLVESNLLKTGGDIPEGHFEDLAMKATIVPGRNLIMASILTGYVQSRGGGRIYMGMHRGDRAIYPDCRIDFTHALQNTMLLSSDDSQVYLSTPFIGTDKVGILETGFRLGVPYELTRTCYKDQPIACGKCGSCQERLYAFAMIDKVDPIEYETYDADPTAY